MSSATSSSSISGYRRRRQTRLAVRLADVLSRKIITIGGIGTIITVSVVFLYLAWVVLPLFEAPEISAVRTCPMQQIRQPLSFAVDEYKLMGWTITPDGQLTLFRLDNGQILRQEDLSQPAAVTAVSASIDGQEIILGYRDGTVRLGSIHIRSQIADPQQLTREQRSLPPGEVLNLKQGLLSHSEYGFRQHHFEMDLGGAIKVEEGGSIIHVDRSGRSDGTLFTAMTEQGRVVIRSVREQENLMTGEMTLHLSGGEFQLPEFDPDDPPEHLALSKTGDTIYVIWSDGRLLRYDTRQAEKPVLAERKDLLSDDQSRITAVRFLLGRATLLVGDSQGNLNAWFRVRDEEARRYPDNWRFVNAHHQPGAGQAITSINVSQRSRIAAVGYDDGTLRLFHITSNQLLTEFETSPARPVEAVAIAPKEDALYAMTGSQLASWALQTQHPEANVVSLFLPVWYEGSPEPVHVWQSSSGDDAFEPKLGLMPLIFGTVKATVYSLLFAVPLSLLSAIYTSEFLHPALRSKIKPTIELMASLPSVVLGFLAALVVAPYVETHLPIILTGLFLMPIICQAGAYVWQLLPDRMTLAFAHWRLLLITCCLILGGLLAMVMGPAVEAVFFAGDIMIWLHGQRGSGTSGWLLFTLPLAFLLAGIAISLWINPLIRRHVGPRGRGITAVAELIKFLLAMVAAAGIAFILAALFNQILWDPRGGSSFLGTYVQRNALVVGFIMGFAIIPIIYTIAEDALSTVPDHLRAASLGAGATQWQTAVRIVVPAAISGLFSAIMIGLGRAVGETMIVLMAGGNTPVMEWNIFNGIRTLSANIAVELPEAPQGSTHYRTLFLAALVLFVMTFFINTLAEMIRLRFRRKTYQL